MAFKILKKNPNIDILGNHEAKRLPIFSFLVKHQQSSKLLHYNFVARLLNDLYGLQVRGGCACAGPYALVSVNFKSKIRFHYIGGTINRCITFKRYWHLCINHQNLIGDTCD